MRDTLAAPATTLAKVRAAGWKELVIALSFANLCYLRIWSDLLTYSRSSTYGMKVPFHRADYIAVMINVLLVGAIGWGVTWLVQRSGSRGVRLAARIVFFLLLALPLNAVRAVLAVTHDYLRSPLLILLGTRGVMLLVAGLAAVALLVLWRWPEQLLKATLAVLLILSPLVLITFGQAVWRAVKYDATEFRDAATTPAVGQKRSPRVLWVILDEWDQRLTFLNRPRGIQLPEIDRLRRESFYAANAHSPGPETVISMPELITGRIVAGIAESGPAEMILEYSGGKKVSWTKERNVFDEARAAGFNAALLGYYHPYCRVIPGSLNHCEWWDMSRQYNSMGSTLGELIPNQTRSLFETSLMSAFGLSLTAIGQARTYQEMMARSTVVAADPNYGLVMLHLNTPHAPHVYNRRTGRFDLKNSPIKGYADSLVLADRTVGALRRALERAGMWDTTTVLFSSDHSYRAAEALDGVHDPRIPFLLKMAGPAAGGEYAPEFNTVLTSKLIMAVLGREISTSQDAARWIEAHRTASAQ